MDNVNENYIKKIILLLNEIIFILDCEGETKYFHIIDIEKTLKILEQRNYKQYELAKKKLETLQGCLMNKDLKNMMK